MYDAIVIGARCAGSPIAMLVARKGHRVLLVDRASFPSDTISTHVIHQPGVARLRRWGLLDQIVASNCPPIRRISFEIAGMELSGHPPPAEGVHEAYCPRRTVLDTVLVEAAIAAGAQFRDSFSVKELLFENGAVRGIRGRQYDGKSVDEAARIVIGADGRHSIVARSVEAPVYNQKPIYGCGYYSYWRGIELDSIEFRLLERRGLGLFPTNGGLTCIYVAWPIEEFGAFRADVEDSYLRTIHSTEAVADRARNATMVESIRGTADLRNEFRKPYGPGWALVGDAGYIKDPVTGHGISDAFRDAELLADALDDAWSGGRPLDDALADYERKRNTAAGPLYEFTCHLASFEPPPPMLVRLIEALRGNQPDTDRFLGIVPGTTPVADFFAPANMRRILRQGEPRPAGWERRLP